MSTATRRATAVGLNSVLAFAVVLLVPAGGSRTVPRLVAGPGASAATTGSKRTPAAHRHAGEAKLGLLEAGRAAWPTALRARVRPPVGSRIRRSKPSGMFLEPRPTNAKVVILGRDPADRLNVLLQVHPDGFYTTVPSIREEGEPDSSVTALRGACEETGKEEACETPLELEKFYEEGEVDWWAVLLGGNLTDFAKHDEHLLDSHWVPMEQLDNDHPPILFWDIDRIKQGAAAVGAEP